MSVFVLGSINVDLVAHTPTLPRAGQTLTASSWHIGLGGKGANQAIAASRLGLSTRFVGCVGDDDFGNLALQQIREYGLSDEHIQTQPGASTGVAVITVGNAGENTICIYRGANETIDPAVLGARHAAALSHSRLALLQMEINHAANMWLVQLARRSNCLVCLDPAPVGTAQEIADLVPFCDLLTPNETEASALTGIECDSIDSATAAAQSLIARGVGQVVMKLGARGALLVTAKGRHHVEPPAVEAVDSVAAGDCFNAGLAWGLMRNLSLLEAVEFAVGAGALATTRRGGAASAPSEAEVLNVVGRRFCRSAV